MVGFREQFRLCKAGGMMVKDRYPGDTYESCTCQVFGGFCYSGKCLDHRQKVGAIEGIRVEIFCGAKNRRKK